MNIVSFFNRGMAGKRSAVEPAPAWYHIWIARSPGVVVYAGIVIAGAAGWIWGRSLCPLS